MPDLNPNQTENLSQEETNGGKESQKTVEMPETASFSKNSQLARPSDDQKTAQNLVSDIKNSPVQSAQTPFQTPPNQAIRQDPTKRDERYIKAAENVIHKDKNDPYQEEEDHEDVQISYLKERFGKDIHKS